MSHELVGRRMKVHLNLHRGDFSVTDTRLGRVVANVDAITLTDVRFHVSESMRQRWAVDRGVRKVHAWATGMVTAVGEEPRITRLRKVTYNPFRTGAFTVNDMPVQELPEVTFWNHYGWTSWHDPLCTGCVHDCPWKGRPLGAPFCGVCDDHHEAGGMSA